jgi:hypothetical protein
VTVLEAHVADHRREHLTVGQRPVRHREARTGRGHQATGKDQQAGADRDNDRIAMQTQARRRIVRTRGARRRRRRGGRFHRLEFGVGWSGSPSRWMLVEPRRKRQGLGIPGLGAGSAPADGWDRRPVAGGRQSAAPQPRAPSRLRNPSIRT